MTRLYLIGGVFVVALALGGGGVWWINGLQAKITAQATTIDALYLQNAGCEARALNQAEDKDSDDAIDRIPDSDLRNVPSRWLRDAAPGGVSAD